MKSNIFSVTFAAMSFSDIWAVYGVALPAQESETIELADFTTTPSAASTTVPTLTAVFEKPALASVQPSVKSTSSSLTSVATASSTPHSIPSDTSPHATPLLSNAAILGIGIGSAVLFLITLFFLFGLPYFRRARRGRALQRAIDEVERGIEMRKTGPSEMSASKENMVLESRVEIIMDEDDERERDLVDVVGRWDGWDANGDAEELEEWERGRKGMSLPRREW
ncbi:hypothetical protein FB567DRAFT_626520 [Paraphoma chrysanthemicola]|uniref:Transmembrane protein n=1 Tax=Paraphoma chrysanthemicola TaxID=798071 RepID=A0A8K0RDC8_9PLEO|nr:hypothetical protein FB567DRAFT_626520 [Paraphoma chrysanthemicola]